MGGLHMINYFINAKKYNWKTIKIKRIDITYIGRYKSVHKLLVYLQQEDVPKASKIREIANSMTGNFAVVVETDNWLLGLVDRISGYRLFYRNNQNGCILSNSPRRLMDEGQSRLSPDLESIIEIKMAGYLSGNRTMDKNIFQVRAGEVLICNKKTSSYTIDSYYKLYSKNIRSQDNNALIEELDDITNTIIRRNIEDANGRVIWVPLSGGLDSRLIVCKLKQLGYDNIRTYSYGINGNFDALRAKSVASTLGLRWDFVPTSPEESRKFFLSKERKKYWDFADGLSVVPNLHGMFALKSLIKSGKMQSGDVVINGQSGDFITGQHIPIIGKHEASNDLLLNRILEKHYSLRKGLFLSSESLNLMKGRIEESLGICKDVNNYQDLAKSYEYWEWKERQTKRVVNGQCNYDYFGLNWELPLWDLEYLQFWENLPLNQKVGRSLFVEYLNKMNFYGLFDDYQPFMSRWPKKRIHIQFIGNVLSKTFGKNVSNKYYRRLDWYSQYQYIYALTGRDKYERHWDDYKGPFPYMTDIWLSENIKM
jgi:asparagine synthase (glutamine-hydrolysing)